MRLRQHQSSRQLPRRNEMNATTMNRLAIFAIVFPMFCIGGTGLDESQPDPLLPTLAVVQDAMRPARGIGLEFTRAFSSARDSRLDRGIFGYGWNDSFSICIEKSRKDKISIRLPSGDKRVFVKENDAWRPQDWRDTTKVTETSAAYVFTFENGVVCSFSKMNGRTSLIQDNKGNTLSFTWDGDRLLRVAHTDGQYLSFAYSSDGFLASVVDDCGRRTEYSYKDDMLAEVKSSDGLVTRYEYYGMDGSPSSRAIQRILRSDGAERTYEFDERGFVSAVVDKGVRTEFMRKDGMVAMIIEPDGGVTKLEFGEVGEILRTTDALGNVTKFEYGEYGLLDSIISPSGREVSLFYDSRGRVKSTKSPSGAKTEFAYEKSFGNLASVTDANGQAVLYAYDDVGRGVSVMHTDGTASKVGYSSRGDAVSVFNRRGQSIKLDYDALGRPVRKVWPNGRTFAYVYDMRGNLMSAVDSETGAVRMEYDAAGRMTQIVYPKGRGLAFKYDAAGRLVERTLFDGTAKSSLSADVERFAYNDAGWLVSVSDGNGRKYIENAYDTKTGRLTRQTCGNGVASEYGYDRLGRIASIRHAGASAARAFFEYSYDSDGKCMATCSDEGNETYEYDADGQLTAVIYPDGKKESFKYDAVGNRVSANGVMYTANALNQYKEISSENTQVVTEYDLDGNLIAMTDCDGTVATHYFYDVQNRLVAVTNETKGVRWSCRYDALGNRVSVTDNGITTERVIIPGVLASVAAEYVDGKLAARHIVVGAIHVATLTTNHSTLTTKYYHGDIIGSVRLVTDGEGKEVARASYTAFGSQRDGRASAHLLSLGYVGMLGVESDSTGLLFMRNRYYSPALGRFIQPDPIGLNGEDVNWYRYCGNEVLLRVDPMGYAFLGMSAKGWAVVGAVAVGITAGAALIGVGAAGLAGAYIAGGTALLTGGSLSGLGGVVASSLGYVAAGTTLAGIGVYGGVKYNLDNWDKKPLPIGRETGANSGKPAKEARGGADGDGTAKKSSGQRNLRNRRERKERGSDEDLDRELSEDESDDWCECDNPTVPTNTDHTYYFVCTTCNKVRRRDAKIAKRAERQMQRRGKEGVWQGDPQKIKQAQSVE